MTRLVLLALFVCPLAAGCGQSTANEPAAATARPAPKAKPPGKKAARTPGRQPQAAPMFSKKFD